MSFPSIPDPLVPLWPFSSQYSSYCTAGSAVLFAINDYISTLCRLEVQMQFKTSTQPLPHPVSIWSFNIVLSSGLLAVRRLNKGVSSVCSTEPPFSVFVSSTAFLGPKKRSWGIIESCAFLFHARWVMLEFWHLLHVTFFVDGSAFDTLPGERGSGLESFNCLQGADRGVE